MAEFPSRYVNLGAARLRFGDRVDRLGRYLTRVDPLADAAAAAIDGTPNGFRLFEQALTGAQVSGLPASVAALVRDAEDVPVWVDWEACDRGGELLLRAGPLGGAVLGACSLVLGYASPGGNKPLVFSGRLAEQAARRLNETARFVQAVSRNGGMRPHADGWQITLKVRAIHAHVRRMILATGRWNAEAWGAPVNQHDMAGTILLFSLAIIDGLRRLGMRVPAREAARYMHLWRWVGRVIGVEADILPTTEVEATRLGDVIAATMAPPDADSIKLTRALFDSGFEAANTSAEIRDATRRVRFGRAICRELVGDELADQLEVPRESFRYAMPMMKRLVGGMDRLAKIVPFAERSAVLAGSRYWDRVVEIGLQGATYEFGLPSRLGERAA